MVPYRVIFEELEKRKIKYLIAGGFAVNFHKVQRATMDLDIILNLKRENVEAFVLMMSDLGFVPRLPVKALDFADSKKREEWIKEKGMVVFSFLNPSNPFELIDLFVEEPMPFKDLWRRRLVVTPFGVTINVVGKKDLVTLKETAGRDKDIFDAKELKKQED